MVIIEVYAGMSELICSYCKQRNRISLLYLKGFHLNKKDNHDYRILICYQCRSIITLGKACKACPKLSGVMVNEGQ